MPTITARDLSFRSNLSWAGAVPPKAKLRIKPSFVGGEITYVDTKPALASYATSAKHRRLHDFADLLEADGSAHANVLMALFMAYDMSTEKLAADIRSVLGEKS